MNIIAASETFLKKHSNIMSLFLRVGLAVVFLYAAVSSFISPNEWVGYLPEFVRTLLPTTLVLNVFSVVELLLAAWLLSGVYVRFAGILAAIMLLGIIFSNFSLLPISFRDIGLFFMALALAFMKEDARNLT